MKNQEKKLFPEKMSIMWGKKMMLILFLKKGEWGRKMDGALIRPVYKLNISANYPLTAACMME